MKNKSRSKGVLFLALVLFLVAYSCKKDTVENETPNYQSASDNSKAENLFNGAFKQVSQYAVVVDTGAKGNTKTYPILTVTGSGYPITFTLDYGTRTVCEDLRTRSGKIITVLYAPYLDSASVILSHFENYYETINAIDYHVTGVHTVVNMGRNSANHPIYRVSVDSASILAPDGTIKWTSLRYREFTAGYNTLLNPTDDAYTITGSASGTNIQGESFTVNITQGLQVQFGCPFVKAGKIEVINQNKPTIYIDYGSGDCDANFSVTVNGYTINVVAG